MGISIVCEHAVHSFELDAIDYLLKPFSLPRFLKACNKAQEQYEMRSLYYENQGDDAMIFIKSGNERVRLEIADLLFVESKGNYLQFVGEKQKLISRLTMTEAEDLLPASAFVRIHRSFIVAKKKISRIDRNSLWINEFELPVSARYAERLERMWRT